jgi:hypothetical protein
MKNETIRNMAGIILFYLFIVLGVIAINARVANVSDNTNVINFSN